MNGVECPEFPRRTRLEVRQHAVAWEDFHAGDLSTAVFPCMYCGQPVRSVKELERFVLADLTIVEEP